MMNNPDPQQSFTATLSLFDKPLVLVHKLLKKRIDDPQTAEEHRQLYKRYLESGHADNMLTFEEGIAPETFLFAYHDGVYIVKIKGENGEFVNTVSMEGELRNWTVFDGEDPTYFRIYDDHGTNVKLQDIPDEPSTIRLFSGPQERPVCTYGEFPNFIIITDYPNRGGRFAIFKLEIIKRFTSDGN